MADNILTNDNRTTEDAAIIDRLHNARALNQHWDAADFRAMQARERFSKSREGLFLGVRNRSYLPMSAVLTEMHHAMTLREGYEAGRLA